MAIILHAPSSCSRSLASGHLGSKGRAKGTLKIIINRAPPELSNAFQAVKSLSHWVLFQHAFFHGQALHAKGYSGKASDGADLGLYLGPALCGPKHGNCYCKFSASSNRSSQEEIPKCRLMVSSLFFFAVRARLVVPFFWDKTYYSSALWSAAGNSWNCP